MESSRSAKATARQLLAFGVAIYLMLAMPPGARAGNLDQSGGGWVTAAVAGDFGSLSPKLGKVLWWLDGQVRMRDESGQFWFQGLIRPGLGFAFSKSGSLLAGYAWVRTDPASKPGFYEHRIWQDFVWREPAGRAKRMWRTRLEERLVEDSEDVGVRLRQMMKVSWAVRSGSRLSLVAFDEFFFFLNNTDFGQDAGFDQNRAFVGLAWRFDEAGHVTVELGYLNQFEAIYAQPDRLNHLVMLNFFIRE